MIKKIVVFVIPEMPSKTFFMVKKKLPDNFKQCEILCEVKIRRNPPPPLKGWIGRQSRPLLNEKNAVSPYNEHLMVVINTSKDAFYT